MWMEVAFMHVPGGRGWRVRRGELEHWVTWPGSPLGITEHV
jgi:hypothetical protein